MAAHRYWRFVFPASAYNSVCGISEAELRTSIGGSNVATGGTASASSESSGSFTASKAFDGDHSAGNGWMSQATASAWLKYDFGAGNDKDIVEVKLTTADSYASGFYSGYFPMFGVFQYSDDDDSWTTLLYIGGMVSDFAKTYTFNTDDYSPHNACLSRYGFQAANIGGIPAFDKDDGVVVSIARVTDKHGNKITRKTNHSGNHHIAGTTTNAAVPVSRKVCLIDQKTNELVDVIYTTADGQFDFENIANKPFTVLGEDYSGVQNSVVFSNVAPEPQ